MIRIDNLCFTYPDATLPALQINHLQVTQGSFNLISGQSGSGKSTLLRLMNGLVPHFSGGTVSGEIWVNGLNPLQVGPQVMSRQVGFVFQNPENQFVVDVVEDEIAFSLENAGVPRPEMRLRLDTIFRQLKIDHLRRRKIYSLSGGESQRVAIAAALVLQPPILLLDEPTSQLDPFAAQEVLTLLEDLQKNLNLTILLSEQRLDRVLPFATSMIHLLPLASSIISGTVREVQAISELNSPLIHLAKLKGWHPLPVRVDDARVFVPLDDDVQVKIPPESMEDNQSAPAISVDGLTIRYPQQVALTNINFHVQLGERLVIMGPNGAGKTTLLRCLVGLLKAQKGIITILGKSIDQQSRIEICRLIGFLPQDPNAMLFAESVHEEFEITLKNHGLPIDESVIQALLHRLLLSEKSATYPRDLSTGEMQRTALGAISIADPPILMLDEPTRGLDQLAKLALLSLLMQWNKEGKTILLVTHDVEFAARFASKIILLEDGQIVDRGDPRRIMHSHARYSPQIAQLFPNSRWLTEEDAVSL